MTRKPKAKAARMMRSHLTISLSSGVRDCWHSGFGVKELSSNPIQFLLAIDCVVPIRPTPTLGAGPTRVGVA